jgi:hypothetical protein
MKQKDKNQLLAIIAVAIIFVLWVWHSGVQPTYIKLSTLTGIMFQPQPPSTSIPCSSACAPGQACQGGQCAPALPILTFTFSQPISASDLKGTTAVLKSFNVNTAGMDLTTVNHAKTLISALLSKNGIPFKPTITPPTTITMNSMPSALLQERSLQPLTLTGTGTIWFAKPMRGAA